MYGHQEIVDRSIVRADGAVAIVRGKALSAVVGRLAQLRVFLSKYEPYASRAAMNQRIQEEVRHALGADPQNMDAWVATGLAAPPFGRIL